VKYTEMPEKEQNASNGSPDSLPAATQSIGAPGPIVSDQGSGSQAPADSAQVPAAPAQGSAASLQSEINEHNLYDKMLTMFLYLSMRAKVFIINLVFGYKFPLDAVVENMGTKSLEVNLTERFADLIVKILLKFFHFELELGTSGEPMPFRFFRYDTNNAISNAIISNSVTTYPLPESVVIYLSAATKISPHYTQVITINDKKKLTYNIPVIKLLQLTVNQTVEKGLTFLLPLRVLKFKDRIGNYNLSQTDKSVKVRKGTQGELIKGAYTDIIKGINQGYALGHIDRVDRNQIMKNLAIMYKHVGFGGVMDLTALDDINLEEAKHIREEQDAVTQKATVAEQRATVAEQRATVAEQRATVAEQKSAATEQKSAATEQKVEKLENELLEAKKEIEELNKKFELLMGKS
jgi:hypothetical protein